MNSFEKICFEYAVSSQYNLKQFFLTLLNILKKSDSITDEMKSLSEYGYSISDFNTTIKELFLRMDNTTRLICLKSVIHERFGLDETKVICEKLAVSLIRHVNYDITIKVGRENGYSSELSALSCAIKFNSALVFDEISKCHIDINDTNRKPTDSSESNNYSTLFSEAMSVATNKTYLLPHFLNYLLKSDHNRDDIVNKIAIFRVFETLEGAKVAFDNGYLLEDYIAYQRYSSSMTYVERTIQDIFDGFCSEVTLQKEPDKSEYSTKYKQEDVERKNNLILILTEAKKNNDSYIAPILAKENLSAQLTTILKEKSKNSREYYLSEKTSLAFKFFEELTDIDCFVCDNFDRITPELFKLSKLTYSDPIINYYCNKYGLEVLASKATGIEQAKFIMEKCETDPITMLSHLKNPTLASQFMVAISSL